MAKSDKVVIHPDNGLNKDFIAMTMPLLAVGTFFYGPRTLVLALLAVITAKAADRMAYMLRGRKYDPTENISVTVALIIVLMMPVTVRFRVVVVAVLVAVLVGKEAFGGAGAYPFNPAAVGYCVSAISWSEEMFRYPEPINWVNVAAWWDNLAQKTPSALFDLFRFQNVQLVTGPSYTLKNGGLPTLDIWNLLMGNYAGPLGATCIIVILACGVFLWSKRRLPLSAPLAFIVTIAVITFAFPRAPWGAWQVMPWYNWAQRLETMKYELLAGGLVFSAVFLVPEPYTLPKNTLSRIIYGALLGFATTMFRYFGIFEMGTCFAFLLVNAISGYFDRAVAARAARKANKKGTVSA